MSAFLKEQKQEHQSHSDILEMTKYFSFLTISLKFFFFFLLLLEHIFVYILISRVRNNEQQLVTTCDHQINSCLMVT